MFRLCPTSIPTHSSVFYAFPVSALPRALSPAARPKPSPTLPAARLSSPACPQNPPAPCPPQSSPSWVSGLFQIARLERMPKSVTSETSDASMMSGFSHLSGPDCGWCLRPRTHANPIVKHFPKDEYLPFVKATEAKCIPCKNYQAVACAESGRYAARVRALRAACSTPHGSRRLAESFGTWG